MQSEKQANWGDSYLEIDVLGYRDHRRCEIAITYEIGYTVSNHTGIRFY